MCQSVSQTGDPVPRQIYHITRKLPYAILLLDDPFAGKTFTRKEIFNPDIQSISGDALIWGVFSGDVDAPESIKELINENFASRDCSLIAYLICKAGLIDEYCAWISKIAKGESFILDSYFPASRRSLLCESMERAGFFVVNIQIQKALSRPREREKAPSGAPDGYRRYLEENYLVNEEDYLEANPDVAKAVAEGRMPGGLFHYIFYGRREGRKRAASDSGDKVET